jgi:hypothetical protein
LSGRETSRRDLALFIVWQTVMLGLVALAALGKISWWLIWL